MRRKHRPADGGLDEALEHALDLVDVALCTQLRPGKQAKRSAASASEPPRLFLPTAADRTASPTDLHLTEVSNEVADDLPRAMVRRLAASSGDGPVGASPGEPAGLALDPVERGLGRVAPARGEGRPVLWTDN
jgi:hypothetical protein